MFAVHHKEKQPEALNKLSLIKMETVAKLKTENFRLCKKFYLFSFTNEFNFTASSIGLEIEVVQRFFHSVDEFVFIFPNDSVFDICFDICFHFVSVMV